jgi:hypothetical protein
MTNGKPPSGNGHGTAPNDRAHVAMVDDGPEPDREEDPLRSLAESVAELREQVQRLAQARIDQFLIGLRHRVFWMIAGTVGLVFTMAIFIAAGVFVLYGVALGLTIACGGRAWLGFSLSGLLVIACVCLGLLSAWARRRQIERRSMEEKYARRES